MAPIEHPSNKVTLEKSEIRTQYYMALKIDCRKNLFLYFVRTEKLVNVSPV